MPRHLFIEGERVTLLVSDDAEPELQRGKNHPEVRRYIGAFRTPSRGEGPRDDDSPWTVIVPKGEDAPEEPVGSVSLAPIQRPDAYGNLGVYLLPEAWGNGYALDACAHMIDYGFRELALHRVSATALAPNDRSRRLLGRLGFVHEGTARESQFAEGSYTDVERYGLLRGEWPGPATVLEGGRTDATGDS